MRFLLSFTFCFISSLAYCQTIPITQFLGKSILKKISIPSGIHDDSCYYSNTLLNIELDKNSKIISVILSDNAEEWLIKELDKIKGSIDFSILEKNADSLQIKERKIMVPLIISSQPFNCKGQSNRYWFNSRYYSFNGKLLDGNCQFMPPVEIVLHPSNH